MKAQGKSNRKSKPKRKSRSEAPPSDGNDALAALRGKIDAVDERIQALIAERAGLAKEVGVLKGLKQTVEYYRPEREAQVLRKVVDRNDGPLRDEEMVRLFRELMSACLAQEEPLKVAYLGPEGTFTESAVFKHFGHSVHALAVATIDEVFHEVESGAADFGVSPIENSSEGTVNIHTLDMFLTSPLKICGEIELRIHQHLMGRMDDLKDVKRVCSHPQSLAQCRGWLSQHLPDVEKVPVVSNAEAARRARDEDGTAALAGDAAANVYNLRILFNTVEDRDDNTTRFVVVGRKLFPASGADKTSVLVSAAETETPGVLLHLLAPLALRMVKDAGAHQAAAFARQMHQPHFGGKEPAAGVTMQPLEHGHLAGESGLQLLMRHFCRWPAIRLKRRTDIRGRQAK